MRWTRPLVLASFIATLAAPALGAQARERPDRGLQRQLDSLVQGFRGTVGIYVRHLPSGRTAQVNADSVFPTASMIKVPILLGTFDALESGARARTSRRQPAPAQHDRIRP